jgi:GT2 family glycosyltransferase
MFFSKTVLPERPLVSVVVLNWNGEEDLSKCLQSLSRQSYPRYEIIVVDNASTDGSVESAEKYPQAKIIVNDRNLGFAEGNNIGIRESSGEIIALVNNDIVADEKWISELVKTIEKDPTIGLVGGTIYSSNGEGEIWSTGGRIDLLTGYTWHSRGATIIGELVDDIDYIPACAIVVRKEVIERIGYLDKEYFIYSEDVEWGINTKRVGLKIVLNPDAKVWHNPSATMGKTPLKRYYYLTRNRIRLIIRNFPLRYIPLALLFQIFLNLPYEFIVLRLDGRYIREKAKAVYWNLKNLKKEIGGRRKNLGLGEDRLRIRVSTLVRRLLSSYHGKDRASVFHDSKATESVRPSNQSIHRRTQQ